MQSPTHNRARQRGVALIASLLLLLVVTIMALSMFRGYGISEKIAGNLREKQRAVAAAETAEQFAEYWLTSGSNATNVPVVCAALLNADIGQGQICSNIMTTAAASTTTTWLVAGGAIGVTYVPQNMATAMTVTTNAAAGTFYQQPMFYISYLGQQAGGGQGNVFKIDSAAFGATKNSVAVVESTYLVASQANCLTCQP